MRRRRSDDRPPATEHEARSPDGGSQRRAPGRASGHSLEDRNRQQLYEVARKKNIPGRLKMGEGELIQAIRKAG